MKDSVVHDLIITFYQLGVEEGKAQTHKQNDLHENIDRHIEIAKGASR